MQYIVEYEAIDSKICGLVKDPYSGAPVYITDLYATQNEAALKVQEFIASNSTVTNESSQNSKPKLCCGRR
jgi:hypothetical protein